jgi:hypothetical protein
VLQCGHGEDYVEAGVVHATVKVDEGA